MQLTSDNNLLDQDDDAVDRLFGIDSSHLLKSYLPNAYCSTPEPQKTQLFSRSQVKIPRIDANRLMPYPQESLYEDGRIELSRIEAKNVKKVRPSSTGANSLSIPRTFKRSSYKYENQLWTSPPTCSSLTSETPLEALQIASQRLPQTNEQDTFAKKLQNFEALLKEKDKQQLHKCKPPPSRPSFMSDQRHIRQRQQTLWTTEYSQRRESPARPQVQVKDILVPKSPYRRRRSQQILIMTGPVPLVDLHDHRRRARTPVGTLSIEGTMHDLSLSGVRPKVATEKIHGQSTPLEHTLIPREKKLPRRIQHDMTVGSMLKQSVKFTDDLTNFGKCWVVPNKLSEDDRMRQRLKTLHMNKHFVSSVKRKNDCNLFSSVQMTKPAIMNAAWKRCSTPVSDSRPPSQISSARCVSRVGRSNQGGLEDTPVQTAPVVRKPSLRDFEVIHLPEEDGTKAIFRMLDDFQINDSVDCSAGFACWEKS